MALEPELSALYAGIAGCGIAAHQRDLEAFLKKTYPMLRIKVASDVPNVIYSSPAGERCIAVICGTGSVVYAKTPEAMHRLGGWGWRWESGCSGYDFGRDAMEAALAARDGIGPETCLRELVEQRLGGNVQEKLGDIYRLGQDGVAAFAATVFTAAAREDPVALEILEKNALRLARLINAAAERYDCGQDVVLAGGLTARKDILEAALKPKLNPGLRLLFNEKPQICGAAAGGIELLEVASPEFKEIFFENYRKLTEEKEYAEN